MGYKTPTSRKAKKTETRLNLIPILDAVFIFIFFLLMSTQFIKVFEIASDVPLVSNDPPPKSKKKPLALTIAMKKSGLTVYTGVPSRAVKTFGKTTEGYDLEGLHNYLIGLKKRYMSESSVVLEPSNGLTYEEIVKVMDAVRMFKNTDEAIYTKDKDGLDVKMKNLFHKIIFGNTMGN